MVDTKDSKSFVSDGVRVQVSSPVKSSRVCRELFLCVPNFGTVCAPKYKTYLANKTSRLLLFIANPFEKLI